MKEWPIVTGKPREEPNPGKPKVRWENRIKKILPAFGQQREELDDETCTKKKTCGGLT